MIDCFIAFQKDEYMCLGICFICSIDVWLQVCTSENQLENYAVTLTINWMNSSDHLQTWHSSDLYSSKFCIRTVILNFWKNHRMCLCHMSDQMIPVVSFGLEI